MVYIIDVLYSHNLVIITCTRPKGLYRIIGSVYSFLFRFYWNYNKFGIAR